MTAKLKKSVDDSGKEDAENRVDEPIDKCDDNSNDKGKFMIVKIPKYSSEDAFVILLDKFFIFLLFLLFLFLFLSK